MSEIFYYILGALFFFVALMLSIMLHELGHMVVAKKCGVTVTQYFLGFGKTLWSTHWRGTEYGVKAVPLGGFVRIVGMFRRPKSSETEETETSWTRRLIYFARQKEYASVPEDLPDNEMFYNLPWYQKAAILLAGPLANFIIAFALFIICFGIIGQTITYVNPKPQISKVANCIEDNTGVTVKHCSNHDMAPAFRAGIKSGDKIVSINGIATKTWTKAVKLIEDNGDRKVTIVVDRAGKDLSIPVTLTKVNRAGKEEGFLGVVNASTTRHYHHGALYTLNFMWSDTKASFVAIGHLPSRLENSVESIGGGVKRNVNDPVSIVGGGEISGQVLSEPTVVLSVKSKIYFMLMLIGSFNLFIGLFNLLPILPLDGGHIFGALYEAVRNMFRRILRLPKGEPFDVANFLPLAYAFTIMLIVVGMVIILADIVAPLSIPIN